MARNINFLDTRVHTCEKSMVSDKEKEKCKPPKLVYNMGYKCNRSWISCQKGRNNDLEKCKN